MKKLTEQEIDQIFGFTKKHYVEYYDVQVELVDHLANAIEKQWEENPNLSFEDALQIEFKKFGIFGFTGLVEKKQAELHSYYNSMLWNEVKNFISIPKIILTISLYLGVFFFLEKFQSLGAITLYLLLFSIILFFMIDGFLFIYKIKKHQKKNGKSWLIQSIAHQVFSLPTIGFTGLGFSLVNRVFSDSIGNISVVGLHLFTTLVTIHFIVFYVFYRVLKPKLIESIKNTENKFKLV